MTGEQEGSKDFYSYHIFLFPFKWDYKASDTSIENIPFEERTRIDYFDKSLDKKRWIANDFSIEKGIDYNEWIYFYPFVRQAIYTTNDQKEGLIKQYLFALKDDGIYSIHTKKGKQRYDLDLERITLNCYDTGVAILTYHLKNSKYTDKEDILIINDFGRRIHPSFLDANSFDISFTKNSFLADKIELNYDEDNPITESEDFSYYDNPDSIKQNPIYLPNHVGKLLGTNFKTANIQNGDILVDPIIDDRMYVICWYGNDNESERLKEWNGSDKIYKYELDDFWYQFIFIDNDEVTCTGRKMKQNLINQSTNTRWIEDTEKTKYGTLYGITRYSFLMLTNEGWFSKTILPNHLKTMYYQMVMLNLAQRASVLRFSSEITYVSGLNDDVIVDSVKQLYKKYLRFLNKIHFREVTAQEQGIELYDKLQEMMKIERDVQNMDRELEELHNYAILVEGEKRLKEEQEQTKIEKQREYDEKERERKRQVREDARKIIEGQKTDAINRLSLIGALFLIPTFISGYYGMNIFNDKLTPFSIGYFVFVFFSFALICFSTYKMFGIKIFESAKSSDSDKMSARKKWFGGLMFFILLLMLAPFANLWINEVEKMPASEIQQIELIKAIERIESKIEENTNAIIEINKDSLNIDYQKKSNNQ